MPCIPLGWDQGRQCTFQEDTNSPGKGDEWVGLGCTWFLRKPEGTTLSGPKEPHLPQALAPLSNPTPARGLLTQGLSIKKAWVKWPFLLGHSASLLAETGERQNALEEKSTLHLGKGA